MPLIHKSLTLALASTLLASVSLEAASMATTPPPQQQQEQHVVAESEMNAALTRNAEAESEQREAIRKVLRHPRVQQVAETLGLDVARADAAVSTLEGEALAQVASQATAAEDALAGGAVLTITHTMLIIILLVVIILILVV